MKFLPFHRKFETKSQKESAIQHVPIFAELSREEKDWIHRGSRLVDYKKDDIVFEEGAAPVAFYVVISGLFKLTALSKSTGLEKKIVDFYPGDHFGETSILTGNLHRTATARAKTDGVLVVIDKEEFEILFMRDKKEYDLLDNEFLYDLSVPIEFRIAKPLSNFDGTVKVKSFSFDSDKMYDLNLFKMTCSCPDFQEGMRSRH